MSASPSSSRSRTLARAKKRKRERGIALIMVLGAIAVLTVMLADFQDETSTELAGAVAEKDGVQAEYMARSAVNLSRLLIASEPTVRAAISPLFMMMKKTPPQLPVWEFSDRILGMFNDQQASTETTSAIGLDFSQGKNLGMPEGRFELVIVDEDSKINVNLGASNEIAHIRLAKELMGLMAGAQFNPLFDQADPSGTRHDRLAICSALIDWSDVDEQTFNCDMAQSAGGGGSVEDAFYQLLKNPYRRKNAPYDSLDELHMVRGIGDDFWSTFVDPDPEQPQKRVITVWGQGAVNINTANAQTLLGVVCAGAPTAEVCTNVAQASSFLTGVTMARGFTMGAPLFGSSGDFIKMMKGEGQLGPLLTTIGMKPVKFLSESEFAKSITTESKMFSIYAVGVKKGVKRETRIRVHAVVDFRSAAPIGGPALPGFPGSPNAALGTNPLASQVQTKPTSTGSDTGAITAVMGPNTGGTIVYYRVE
jgi:general secretion pathway protein K